MISDLLPITLDDQIAAVRREIAMREIVITPSLRSRFDELCIPEPNSGCWLWVGATRPSGYGEIFTGSKANGTAYPAQAHRVGYLLYRGEIGTGNVLDHRCRVHSCVNPWHLEAVTVAVNTRRGVAGHHMREKSAEADTCKNGHQKTADNIYVRANGWFGCRICRTEASRKSRNRQRAVP